MQNLKIILIVFLSFFSLISKAQDIYTAEKILWVCPNDPNLKITYRMGNYSNEIELTGPFNMLSNNRITGILKISQGTFQPPKQLSPEETANIYFNKKNYADESSTLQTLEILIAEKYYTKTISYYKSDTKPNVSFEGKCESSSQEEGELSEIQTKKIFDLFFGANSSQELTIINEDKKQAKDLLKELISASCKMSIVESLYDLDPSLISICYAIYSSISNCNKVKKGSYYETVRKTIAFNFSTSFQIRKQTGEW